MKAKKSGKTRGLLNFFFSTDSWKKSFTVPFKRYPRYLKSMKEMANEAIHANDDLVPAEGADDLRLTITKTRNSALALIPFILGFGLFIVLGANTLYQMLACLAIMFVFGLRFLVALYVHAKAKEQLRLLRQQS